MMTGSDGCRVRISRNRSSPDMPSMITSAMTKSQEWSSSQASASGPLPTLSAR